MATVREGSRKALVVIDVQNDVVGEAWDRDGVVTRLATLVDRARRERVPVIFVQHEDAGMPAGSEAWQFVPELVPADGEPVIAKKFPDSFEETGMKSLLADLGISHLVIAGAQTDACIRFTSHRALAEGYDMTLVGDCHTTNDIQYGDVDVKAKDVIAHTNLVYQFVSYPNRAVSVANHDEISFATPDATQENQEHAVLP